MIRTDKKRLARIVQSFEGKEIGVLGDFMLDELWQGEVSRISPEAPVPVVLTDAPSGPQVFPGGAGNVAANIQTLGAHPLPFGVVGNDQSGQALIRLLGARGHRPRTLVLDSGRITPRKIRIAAHHQQLLRLDVERPIPLSARSTRQLVHRFARWSDRLDALVVSDYRKGTVTAELSRQVLPLACRRGVPVFVDPKPPNAAICRHATVATPNLKEAETMLGSSLADRRSLEEGGQRLLRQLECEFLLITRGAEGMMLFGPEGEIDEIPSVPRPIYDVTGAGDTVIAVLALASSAGATMREAAQLANLAAGCVVLKFGTSPVTAAELLEAIRQI